MSFINGKNAQAVIAQNGRWKPWSRIRWRWNDWRLPSYLQYPHKTFGIAVLIRFRNCFMKNDQSHPNLYQNCTRWGRAFSINSAWRSPAEHRCKTLGYLTIAIHENDTNRKTPLPFDWFMIRSWFWVPYFWKFPKKAVKSPSAKKPRESRRISAKKSTWKLGESRRKNPAKARRISAKKTPWKLGETRRNSAKKPRPSSAKSRRKCSPREISRGSGPRFAPLSL